MFFGKTIRVHTVFFGVVLLFLMFPVLVLGLIQPFIGEFNYLFFGVIVLVDFLVVAYGSYIFVKALRGEVEWYGPGVGDGSDQNSVEIDE